MRRQVLLAALFVVASINSLQAYTIDNVTVHPLGYIIYTDSVSIEVLITTPGSSAFIYQQTDVVIDGNDIQIVVYIDSGSLGALDSWVETVNLGVMDPGDYNYAIHLEPPAPASWSILDASGVFTVLPDAPIPAVSSWGLIIVTLLLLSAGTILLKNKHVAFHTRSS